MSGEPVTLDFIGKQLQRLTTEVATLRDDMTVTAAILRRLDNGQRDMLAELRALHDIQQRWVARVRALEEQP